MNTPNGVDLHIEAVALARDVPGIAEEIASYAQTIGLDLQASFKLKISIAEALNNIAGHGVDPEHPGIIKITCRRSERVLEISIIDTGRPIDTLPTGLFPLYDVEHGRGWPIMVSWIDQIEYQPGPPFNRLSLTKHLW
jgi:anti-sigma regulatory factor (Ser/Thr protein kinase)